jgi:hypothetical protein
MKLPKKQHVGDVSLDESVETALLDVEDPSPNPEQFDAKEERQPILSTAMNELTPGTRKAIELKLTSGQAKRRVESRNFR